MRFRVPIAALLAACATAPTAYATCWTDKDCDNGTVCYCVRYLNAELERCDEMGGVCAVDDPADVQRAALSLAREQRSKGSARGTGDPVPAE